MVRGIKAYHARLADQYDVAQTGAWYCHVWVSQAFGGKRRDPSLKDLRRSRLDARSDPEVHVTEHQRELMRQFDEQLVRAKLDHLKDVQARKRKRA